ncbi:MAG TPA: DinB family protein [Ignavibacteria bacterium]|jgi:uncharacterized damage-inducible protein DinB
MKELLESYTKYNLWANAKFTEFLLGLDPEMLDKEILSSFNSIRKTVYHIWDAEVIWYNRLKGVSFTDWPSKKFSGTDHDFFKQFVEHSSRFAVFVDDKTEAELGVKFKYKTMDGKEYENKIADTVQHVVNHSSFHRGQLITMLRSAGYTELPWTDYIAFLRERIK